MKVNSLTKKDIKRITTWKLTGYQGDMRILTQCQPSVAVREGYIEIGREDEQFIVEIEYADGQIEVYETDGSLAFVSKGKLRG